jgi:calcium permeable stress-gated cation channel
MTLSDGEVTRKKIHGFLWLAVICFLNTVPLLIISALANLSTVSSRFRKNINGNANWNDQLTTYIHPLAEWQSANKGSFDFISGVLPPAVSAIFGFFLPIIMRKLTRYMGALTHSRTDRAVIARYFAFLVISQLIIFTLIGVIFSMFIVVFHCHAYGWS